MRKRWRVASLTLSLVLRPPPVPVYPRSLALPVTRAPESATSQTNVQAVRAPSLINPQLHHPELATQFIFSPAACRSLLPQATFLLLASFSCYPKKKKKKKKKMQTESRLRVPFNFAGFFGLGMIGGKSTVLLDLAFHLPPSPSTLSSPSISPSSVFESLTPLAPLLNRK